jgi:hypothetical protein
MRYVAAVPLSIRLPEKTIGRLTDRAGRSNMPSRTLAQRYVEEGLRMDEHPLIRFADGDLAETAAYLELPLGLVQAAASYYGAYPREIDERIERNRHEAHDAHATFLAAREALGR